MDPIRLPSHYLAIRYVQAPLAALVFVVDIIAIRLVASDGEYTYGSLGFCAVVSWFTVVVCSVHIGRIRANSGFNHGLTILLYEVISKLAWLTVWIVMAWSAWNINDTQQGDSWQAILGCIALAATAAAIEWILFSVTLVTSIAFWIRCNRDESAPESAPAAFTTVTPNKIEQGIPTEYPNQYPAQSYPAQTYPTQVYPAQSYPALSYPAQSDPAQSYPAQAAHY